MHAYKSRQKNISDRLNGKKVRLIAVCARMYVCNNRVIIQNSRYVEILDYQKCPSSADRFHSISSSKEDKKRCIEETRMRLAAQLRMEQCLPI